MLNQTGGLETQTLVDAMTVNLRTLQGPLMRLPYVRYNPANLYSYLLMRALWAAVGLKSELPITMLDRRIGVFSRFATSAP